jgi:predicted ATPase
LGKENPEMPGNSQPDFLTKQLDVDLLSTPFKVQTKWHVISGAPSSGKTTLIGQLADKGSQVVPETARRIIESEMARGQTIQEIFENQATLQHRLIDVQLRVERGLRANDVLFLDRGIPDHFAYCRICGVDPNEFLPECFHHRYASVFILDPLPFQEDGARDKDAVIASYLGDWAARDYIALGYDIVRVPVLAPEERLAFVLERLSEQGLM